jgi:hypothetical protein
MALIHDKMESGRMHIELGQGLFGRRGSIDSVNPLFGNAHPELTLEATTISAATGEGGTGEGGTAAPSSSVVDVSPPIARRSAAWQTFGGIVVYWAVMAALVAALYPAIALRDLANNRATTHEVKFPWLLPPLQALFFIALMCNAAELALRFVRVEHEINRRATGFLVVVFFMCVLLFAATPQFAYMHEDPTATVVAPFSEGNCTNLNDLHPLKQDAMKKFCPYFDFDDAFVQPAGSHFVSGNSMLQTIERTVTELGVFNEIRDLLPTVILPSLVTKAGGLSDPQCSHLAISAFCEASFVRCVHQNCSKQRIVARACSLAKVIDEWVHCSNNVCMQTSQCSVDSSAKSVETGRKMAQTWITDVITEFFKSEFNVALATKGQVDMLTDVTSQLPEMLSEMSRDDCGQLRGASNSMPNPKAGSTSSTSERVGCDPLTRTYMASSSVDTRRVDSGHIFAIVFIILNLFVLTMARHQPEFAFISAADRCARITSVILGVVASSFIFLAGQNYETISINFENSGNEGLADVVFTLRVWSVLNFVVAFLCIHHAMFLLVSGHSQEFALITTMRVRFPQFDRMIVTIEGFTHGKGAYFGVFLVLREIVETAIQVLGLDTTAREKGVDFLKMRTTVVCLNLILLPIMAFGGYKFWGATMAKVAVIVCESVFDNVFIMVGVLFSLGGDNEEGNIGGFGAQLLKNAPSLLPAVLFFTTDQTPLMIFAELALEKERQRRENAASVIQGWVRGFSFRHARRRRASNASMADIVQSASARTLGGDSSREDTTSSCLARLKRRGLQILSGRLILGIVMIVSVIVGVVMWTVILAVIQGREDACAQQVGSIARCMFPKRYFKQHGLFGETTCSFNDVEVANCAAGRLVDTASGKPTTVMPEAPDVYENMTKLSLINVSANRGLERVPASWGRLSDLHLDLSGCEALHGLPFSLCEESESSSGRLMRLRALKIGGTRIQRSLNWSGQISRGFRTSWPPTFSQVCEKVFVDTLTSLDLSHNSMTSDDVGQLKWIRKMNKLSSLYLLHNQIRALTVELFSFTREIWKTGWREKPNVNTSYINFVGNPVDNVSMNAFKIHRLINTIQSLGGPKTCQNGLHAISITAFVGNTDEFLDKVLPALQLSCFWPMLRSIRLEGNRIRSLPDGSFKGLGNLDVLSLRANPGPCPFHPDSYGFNQNVADLQPPFCETPSASPTLPPSSSPTTGINNISNSSVPDSACVDDVQSLRDALPGYGVPSIVVDFFKNSENCEDVQAVVDSIAMLKSLVEGGKVCEDARTKPFCKLYCSACAGGR